MRMVDGGKLLFDTVVVIDAMSVFQAVTGLVVKEPAEKGLLPHLQYLREKRLVNYERSSLRWADTRDMNSDGHTKGSIARDATITVMEGKFSDNHKFVNWQPKIRYDSEGRIREGAKLIHVIQKYFQASGAAVTVAFVKAQY